MFDPVAGRLAGLIAPERVLPNAPLAPYTTFKVGGTADWLVLAQRAGDVTHALTVARECGIPVVVLGGGSNVLVADSGLRGLVIRLHGGDAALAGERIVRADAGLTINGLVRWTINRGLAGLESWAGTPVTVGGAIRGNAHCRGRLMSVVGDQVDIGDAMGISNL